MLSLGEMVFMGRLESGLLLFETPQGLVHVELSFKERLAPLWAFRNFRPLLPPIGGKWYLWGDLNLAFCCLKHRKDWCTLSFPLRSGLPCSGRSATFAGFRPRSGGNGIYGET